MNLGRYTVSTPANPASASVSFTESIPQAPHLEDDRRDSDPSARRKGKQRETYRPSPLLDPDQGDRGSKRTSRRNGHFVLAGEQGFEVWSNRPSLKQLLRRNLPGSLSIAHPLPLTPLFALVGGGRNPVFPPNKVILWLETIHRSEEDNQHEGKGRAVASIEYGERVLRIVSRCNGFLVILSQSAHYYEYGMKEPHLNRAPAPHDPLYSKGKGRAADDGFWLDKKGEWQTCLGTLSVDLDTGFMTIPGRQHGHVQLVQLSPCRNRPLKQEKQEPLPPKFRTPIVVAHTHALSSLSCTSDGKYLVTASERGTLLRVWNTRTGTMERELRRGLDRADIWGTAMTYEPWPGELSSGEPHEGELMLVCWSDKGTIHVWRDVLGRKRLDADAEKRRKAESALKPSFRSLLDPYMNKSKYFTSTPSTVLFRLPRPERSTKQVIKDHSGPSATRPSMEELRLNEMYQVVWAQGETAIPPSAKTRTRTPTTPTRRKRTQFDIPRKPSDPSQEDSSTATTSGNLHLASHQLIVVTHTGEWFRLGVPDGKVEQEATSDSDNEGDAGRPGLGNTTTVRPSDVVCERADRCKVLEYRRLRTASADW